MVDSNNRGRDPSNFFFQLPSGEPRLPLRRSRSLFRRVSLPFIVELAVVLFSPQGRSQSLSAIPKTTSSGDLPAVQTQIQNALVAARANPKIATASGNLGMILDSYRQYAPAAACYLRAHILDMGPFRWAYYLGWAQATLGRYGKAALTLRQALRLDPDYLPARLRLSGSLLAEGKLEEAEGA